MLKMLTPKEEAIRHDREMDKRSGNSEPLSKEQKQVIKEREERNRLHAENSKREYLKPFIEFLADPLANIKYLSEQGDFSGSYDKRMELFSLMTLVQIQESLKELVLLLNKKK
ncbi:hypothetical protein ES703_15291 [subsurface metagenome]